MSGDARLYAGTIALVSGAYSIAAGLAGEMAAMAMGETVMLIVGIVVLAHGIVLLTPLAASLGRASGPLMIVWAAIMLGNQALAATARSGPMSQPMSWDGGMVAVAVLMLASGLIMSRRRRMS